MRMIRKRRVVSIITSTLMMAALLTGCGAASQNVKETGNQNINIEANNQNSNKTNNESDKILVAYFSRAENIGGTPDVDATSSASINLNGSSMTGNLKLMADYIVDNTGADEFSITTVDSYPKGYEDTINLAKTEQAKNARPALSSTVEDMSQYDVIYLGYPNWWGGLPMPVCTFLESYDFKGKTIIPFASHGGSGLGSGPAEIKKLCPGSTILEGYAIDHSNVAAKLSGMKDWINSVSK